MNIINKIPLLRSVVRAWNLRCFQKQWRKRNRHNDTVACNIFPMDIVSVGKGTYGELHIMSYYPEAEKLMIGNYVSLAPDIHFILGGNHAMDKLFTYPIMSRMYKEHCLEDAESKGFILIGDDVWIGYGATILSGVVIGKGSVIGAKAVVACDVPPFSIAVGNPARVIKKRFPDSVIEKIKKINLVDIPSDRWMLLEEELYTTLNTEEKIDNVVDMIRQYGYKK